MKKPEQKYHTFKNHIGGSYSVPVRRVLSHAVAKKLRYNKEREKTGRWTN